MFSRLLFFISLILTLSSPVSADPLPDTQRHTDQPFESINLTHFIDNNQIPTDMAAAKKRVMLPPSAIQFDATLLQPPKPGEFTLVYDALSLWQSDAPMPNVDHSAFLQADDNRVIGVYVSSAAAEQLKVIASHAMNKPIKSHIYAVHIYNYAKGPRLVVLGASDLTQ